MISEILYILFVLFVSCVVMDYAKKQSEKGIDDLSIRLDGAVKQLSKGLSDSMSEFAERTNRAMAENQENINDFVVSKSEVIRNLAENQKSLNAELKELVETGEEIQNQLNDMDGAYNKLALRMREAEHQIKIDRRELTKRINGKEDEVKTSLSIMSETIARDQSKLEAQFEELLKKTEESDQTELWRSELDEVRKDIEGLGAEIDEVVKRIEVLELVGEQTAGINNQVHMMMDYNPQKEIGVVR